MMSSWVLVYMVCSRSCVAQYAIPFETRKECVRNIPKQEGMIVTDKYVCIPTSKD